MTRIKSNQKAKMLNFDSFFQSSAAKIIETKSTGINPARFNDEACEVGTLKVGVVTVELVPVDGVFEVSVDSANVPPVEFVPFPAVATSPARAPKYASFLVTLSSNMVPSPVPGNVEGIQEYCDC